MHNTRSKPYNGRLHVTNKKLYTQDKWNLMLLTDMLWITINLYDMDHYYFFMYFQSAFSLVLNSLYIQIWSIGSIHAKAFWFFFYVWIPPDAAFIQKLWVLFIFRSDHIFLLLFILSTYNRWKVLSIHAKAFWFLLIGQIHYLTCLYQTGTTKRLGGRCTGEINE